MDDQRTKKEKLETYPKWDSEIELDFLVEELFLNIWFNAYYLNNFQLINAVFYYSLVPSKSLPPTGR